jgi:hypothetical protein
MLFFLAVAARLLLWWEWADSSLSALVNSELLLEKAEEEEGV